MAKAKSGAIQISRKGMLVWIGLFLFVATWMFVLGILVGRGIAPVNLETESLEQELAELKALVLKKEQAKVEKQAAGKGSDKPQLGFYEALKDPKDEKRYKTPVAPKPKPATKPRPVVKPVPKPPPKPAAAEKKAPAAKPVPAAAQKPAPKPAPAPAPAVAAAKKGRYAIQVSAVKDVNSAAKLVDRLRKKGYRAYQIRSEVPGKGVWYRVRVGAYESRDAAGATLKKLRADRFGGMIIGTR